MTTSARAEREQRVLPDSYRLLAESFRRKLLAENKSPRTVQTYGEALRLFGDFIAATGMPAQVEHITREHVEAFITDLLVRFKPATANNRYRALQVFFKWLVEEGELTSSPMARMQPPSVPEEPPDVLGDDDLKRLLNLRRVRRTPGTDCRPTTASSRTSGTS